MTNGVQARLEFFQRDRAIVVRVQSIDEVAVRFPSQFQGLQQVVVLGNAGLDLIELQRAGVVRIHLIVERI